MVGGYISQYHLDTLINNYFIRIDISPLLHKYYTAIKILKCIYNFPEDLEKVDARLNISASISLAVNHFIMLLMLHFEKNLYMCTHYCILDFFQPSLVKRLVQICQGIECIKEFISNMTSLKEHVNSTYSNTYYSICCNHWQL